MVKTASLYDNFCKTGNYVIYDVIIWVPDGNCKKKWLERILVLVRSAIWPKNQDNPIKTVGRDSFLSPKTPKNTSFLGVTQPRGLHSPYILGDTTQTYNMCPSLIEIGSKTAEKNSAQTNRQTLQK